MSVSFDTLQYTKGAEAVGIKREHAEYQAQQISKLVNEELVTKSFLEIKLKELEMRMIIKMGTMMIAQTGIIFTILNSLLKHTST